MTDTPDQVRQDALDSAARHAERIVRAVGWLRVLTVPGREPRPAAPLLTDAQRAEAAERSHAEAIDRASNMRAGLAAAPAGSTPVDLSALTAQRNAVREVGRLVRRVVRLTGGRHRFGEAVTIRNLVQALDWLGGDGGPMVWAVTSTGAAYRRGVLSDVADTVAVGLVAEQLADVAERARAAAGITDERVVPYPVQPCPACRRRSLQIDATLRNPQYWTVSCISEACRCAGPGCGCVRRYRTEGERHVWGYAELPMLDWAQARARQAHPVRSGTTGHGGWSERRRGAR